MAINQKTIAELKNYSFFVPSYQRGYRWTEREVNALLNDLDEFVADGEKKYCLQPLIVKKRQDGSYEVVDGQQRLTTIYIFMKIAAQEIRSAVPPFSVKYETRMDSAKFLESLSDDVKKDNHNIDFYHIASAYQHMNDWIDKQEDRSVAIQELNTKIRKSVFFIWHEIPEQEDSIELFTKVNIGKIPLTDAELIKALLMNQDHFKKDVHKKQMEMSMAWDRIEQGLREDSFWYFLHESEPSGTRIDLLFELLATEYATTHGLNQINRQQPYFAFLVFSTLIEHKVSSERETLVHDIWAKTEKLYAEFRDWYHDVDTFHVIGYLITTGVRLADILKLTRGKRKTLVMTELLQVAKKGLGNYTLAELSYDIARERQKIKRLLLLFNLATIVCKSEKQYRFPFDLYKGETNERMKWDIEHIHATADESGESDSTLGNLTLLDAQTNRQYKNAEFQVKRRTILERESKGLFVPLCTKNIFLKAYSKNLKDMDSWVKQDKVDYIETMDETINKFFKGEFTRG